MILCVGTFEPRKNQVRVLRAARLLWAQGLCFKLVFLGNPGWLNKQFLNEAEADQSRGFNLELVRACSDAALRQYYRSARFTVFCSLAEGFGLPIVESVELGAPCLTSDRGSMKEIGKKVGGCVFADPESIEDIAQNMQRLLIDDALIEDLKRSVVPWPSWENYSDALFKFATEET
jgi:glycosyltransferase involved in cell wall biosynthesis